MRHYLLSGRSGVGKSSFINSFFGEPLAEVNDYEACTKLPEYHTDRGGLGDICLIDSPGLAEGDGSKDGDYLDRIAERIKGVQIEGLIYVSPLHDARFRPEEQSALSKLTARLGPRIWWSSWLVFTFSGTVSEVQRKERVPARVAEFTAHLQEQTDAHNGIRRFRGFRQVLLVDNTTPDWTPGTRPLVSFFRASPFDGDDQRGPPALGLPAVAIGHFPELSLWLRSAPKKPIRSESDMTIGIDLGTSESRVASGDVRSASASIIPCALGATRTPSAVYFGAEETLVGEPALDQLTLPEEAGRVVLGPKRFLDSVDPLPIPGPEVDAVRANAEILKKLVVDAAYGRIGPAARQAILTHPSDLGSVGQRQFLDAVNQIGFEEVRLLAEPVAAAIALDRAASVVADNILVIDCGASRISFALVSRGDDGSFRLALPVRSLSQAGQHFDERLHSHLEEVALAETGSLLVPEGRPDASLLQDCRRLKETLSQRGRADVRQLTLDGAPFRHTLHRSTFEGLIRPTLDRAARLAGSFHAECLAQAGQIDAVLLIGGSSRLPALRDAIRTALPTKPIVPPGPESVVALGAAYHAANLWGDQRPAHGGRVRIPETTSLSDMVHRLEAREAEEKQRMRVDEETERKLVQRRILDQFAARVEAIDAEVATLRKDLGLQLGDRNYARARETLSALLRLLPDDPELAKTKRFLDERLGPIGEVRTISAGQDVTSIAFMPDAMTAIAALSNGQLAVCDLSAGKIDRLFPEASCRVNRVAIHQGTESCASGGVDNMIRTWYLPKGKQTKSCNHGAQINHLAFLPSGEQIVTCSDDLRIRLWSTKDLAPVSVFEGHTEPVREVSPSPDGLTLVSASNDQSVRLWDLATGREVRRMKGHRGKVAAVCFFPGGRLAGSGGEDGTIRMWDTTSGREMSRWEGHDGAVNYLTFTSDGRHAVSGGQDGTVRVWDVASGWGARKFTGHSGAVRSLSVSVDGRHTVSGGADKTIRLWALGV